MSETPKYFIARNGVQSGPFTNSEIRKKASNNELLQSDYVFKHGMSDWVEARRIKGLFNNQYFYSQVNRAKPPQHVKTSRHQVVSIDYDYDEEIPHRSFFEKLKSFVFNTILIGTFMIFLTILSLSIVTTSKQRSDFIKQVLHNIEQNRKEMQQRKIEEERLAKEEAERNPKPVQSKSITKDEWRAIFNKSIKDERGYADLKKLDKVFGKPDRTRTIGEKKIKYYECSDGTMEFEYHSYYVDLVDWRAFTLNDF